MASAPTARVDTIVLIHGLWVTSRSWERWADRYAAQGFRVLTPAWPGMEVEVEALREDPANRHRAVPFTADDFHYAFGNTMSREDSDAAWERYAVPGAGHVLFEAAFANLDPNSATQVNTHRSDRAPLLLLAGGADHVLPPSVVSANAQLYRPSRAVTAYHEFPGRSHFVGGEPGWDQEADYALDWAVEMANTVSPTVVSAAPGR